MRVMRRVGQLLVLAAAIAASPSCGKAVRSGRAPVYLVINSLEAATGANPSQFFGNLLSDVLTLVTQGGVCTTASPCPTYFNDEGQVTLSIALKDIGPLDNPTEPTTNNQVTITRYHVEYVRSDGRHTPGVDVPYGFDGAVTGTVTGTSQTQLVFLLVRNIAKTESPLLELADTKNLISTMANVTFYGTDLAGNTISATGSIQIDFGNFGDQ